ncbi:MAG: M48 family metalloprotease, partial [Pseudomonadota bacterium]|nr:M48 family metalloprotease [Pseudomonadota bacterium]
MDFFAAQDQARRLTWRLVLLFLAAVAAIVAGVNFIAALGVMAAGPQFGAAPVAHWRELSPALYGWVTLATLLIIGGGTLYRIWQLAEGGAAVARMMGARRVAPDTGDPDERRLMNVVEEMAIASGTPAPGVYLLEDERSINAFAAGYSPGEAIVAVTRGCMEQLSRDELQGVIAHEFSHILNGDMRLNIRLIGILNGILVIGAIGMALLRGASVGSRRRRYRSDRRSGGGVIAVLLLGAGLTAVGYAGVLAGRLIKAGVSRQREYFADASAVQFTRDPNGIAGALRKIRAHRLGSRVHNRYAEELSHMFFGPVYRLGFGGLLATHPPLDERIARIDPSFSPAHEPPVGSFTPLPGKSSPVTPLSEYQAPAAPASAVTGGSAPEPAEALASIGHPGPEHVSYAQSLHAAIPALLLTHAHRPHSAATVLYGLIMQTAPDREQKLDALCAQEG